MRVFSQCVTAYRDNVKIIFYNVFIPWLTKLGRYMFNLLRQQLLRELRQLRRQYNHKRKAIEDGREKTWLEILNDFILEIISPY